MQPLSNLRLCPYDGVMMKRLFRTRVLTACLLAVVHRCSRDMWFEVPLPFFLRDHVYGLGWERVAVGAMLAVRRVLTPAPCTCFCLVVVFEPLCVWHVNQPGDGSNTQPRCVVMVLLCRVSSFCMVRSRAGRPNWCCNLSNRAQPTSRSAPESPV
jgi:hypothetical protein